MKIKIYKNTVIDIFNEIKADYELLKSDYETEGAKYSIEDICIDISKSFCDVWGQVRDLIQDEIEKMVATYIIEFNRKYNVLDSVDCLALQMLEEQAEQMKETLFDKWHELPEFENHKMEIEYLRNPANIQKLLESNE